MLGMCKHPRMHAGALCILHGGSTHAMEKRMTKHMLEHAYTPNWHACTLTLVCLLIRLTFYPSMVSCIGASMNKEQRNARARGLFVDHLGYCYARRSRIVHYARCAVPRVPLLAVPLQVVGTRSVLGTGLALAPWSGPAAGLMSCPGVLRCKRLLYDRVRRDLCHVCPP